MSKRTVIYGVILAMNVLACGDGEQRAGRGVLRGEASPPETTSSELQRKRAMQAITVSASNPDLLYDMDVGTLLTTLRIECFHATYGETADPGCGDPSGTQSACGLGVRLNMCVASALMDLAKGNEATLPRLFSGDYYCGSASNQIFPYGPGPYTVLPLNPAQKVEILSQARIWYVSSLQSLSDSIAAGSCRGTNGDSTVAATNMVEAYSGIEDATSMLVEAELAVAESEMVSTPDTPLAIQRSMSSPLFSRASASSWLVGGAVAPSEEKLLTYPGAGDGFCTLPRLSPQAEVALSALREAAPSPIAVLAIPDNPLAPIGGEVSIDDLMNKRGLQTGSVLERLEAVWNTTITEPDIATRLGINREAFVDAREYMAQEIRAFARPLDQVKSQAGNFALYSATATPPAPRGSAYYAAIGRSSPTIIGGWSWYVDVPFNSSSCRTDMNFLTTAGRGYGLDRIRENMVHYVDCLESKEGATHVAPLLAIRTNIKRVRKETIEHEYHFTASWVVDGQNIRIASGAVAGRGYRVVRGESALECLTRGTIDGLDCRERVASGQPGGVWNVCDLQDGAVPACHLASIAAVDETWYVLRSHDGANWSGSGWDTAVGRWEPVTGFRTPKSIPSPFVAFPIAKRTIPVYSDIEERLAKVLEPSRSWCTKPERNCLGLRESDPIPLENELSTDGDDSESSWKHYLTLAADAAAKSDELAQQYFDSSLSVDQLKVDQDRYLINKEEQTVAKLEELQSICGAGVDASDLLDAIGDLPKDFDMKSLYQGECQGNEDAPGSIYDCNFQMRSVSIPKLIWLHPNLGPLMRCVDDLSSSSSTVDLVHLGDADLCVPQAAIDETCGGVNGPCPDTQLAASKAPFCPQNYRLVPKQNGLAFFNTKSESSNYSAETVCSDLRRQQKSHRSELLESLAYSPILNFVNLREIAKSLSYEAQAGGYVSVRGPNGIIWTTGSTSRGPASGRFPCGTTDLPAECASNGEGAGLTCSPVDCTNDATRGAMNDRLAKAYLAVKLSLWKRNDDPTTFMVPSYIYWGAVPENAYARELTTFRRGADFPIFRESSGAWIRFSDESNFLSTYTPMWHGTFQPSGGWPGPWYLKRNISGIGDIHFGFRKLELTPVGGTVETQQENASRFWGGIGGAYGPKGDYGCLKSFLTGSVGATGNQVVAFSDCKSSRFAFNGGAGWNAGGSTPSFSSMCAGNAKDKFGTYCLKDPGGAKAALDAWTETQQYEGETFASGPVDSLDAGAYNSMADGMQLICKAASDVFGAVDCGDAPPPLRTVDDLASTGAYIECLGRKISLKGATAVFRGIPTAVLDPLRANTGTVYSSANGEMGQALEQLKNALLGTYKSQQTIGHVIRQFGSEMKALQSTMRSYVAQEKIANIQFEATQVRETTTCIAAMSNLIGENTYHNPGSIGAAAATCANSIAQIKFADQMRDAQKKDVGAQAETAIARFNQSFDEKAQLLDLQSTELSESLNVINQQIGRVSDLRNQAFRVLADAVWLLSKDSKSTYNVRVATDNRRAIYASRYKSALENAKRLAFLAKRSIEQRLGLHLDTILEDLPLVEAPARWESTLCFGAYPGLNYKALSRNVSAASGADNVVEGGFISDYVTKLQNVVESYQLANGFQDGKDTAVISLRDDVLNVRRSCLVESRNLLVNSGDLIPKRYGALAAGKGWYVAGCNEALASNVEGTVPTNCVNVVADGPTFRPGGAEVDVPVFRMTFGGGTSAVPCEGVENGTCGYLESSRLAQTVHLRQGSYALTWYQQRLSASEESVIDAYITSNSALTILKPSQDFSGFGTSWVKKIAMFSLAEDADVEVGFRKGATNSSGVAGRNPAIWGAPMLEGITDGQLAVVPWYDISVGKYDMTDANGLARRTSCEDSDGEVFRTKWTTGCVNLCPDGYSTNCSAYTKQACYREIAFPLSQWGAESNSQFVQSGFARGNFNYRIKRLGLNFVGTGLRNCASSELPQSCFSGGFINYSLMHEGPFVVRNHKGTDFLASLFEGRIEHARGLATERFITNPISSTDKSLLEDYMRREMSGRPLSGSFVLRVWDDPNLNFGAIEDIQLVLDYGYWTRLSN